MPPEIMAKVTPMPMRVTALVCRARLRMLRTVKKFLATNEKKINSTIAAAKVMNRSRRLTDRLSVSMGAGAALVSPFSVILLMAALQREKFFGWPYVLLLR